MTVFVQRLPNRQITGVYANRQPGYAEEALADDDPDVVAFRVRLDPMRRISQQSKPST